MEGVKVVSIADLLGRRRPICGTVAITPRRPTCPPPISGDTGTLNPNSKPSSRILKSLPEPSMIAGKLSILSFDQTSPPHSCFSFADDSASVYCDVIDFDFSMIGRSIQVLSWNYIPFKKYGGLLEIINWRFLNDSDYIDVDSFPLVFDDVGNCCDSKAKYSVDGVVQSVSPVLTVPCSVDTTAGEAQNVRGFIVEMVNSDNSGEGMERDRHDFVYFSGSFSSWHPAFLRLVGRVVSLSNLRKKLVYVGKEEGRLMCVTTKVTRLHFMSLKEEDLLCRKRNRCGEEKGGLGMYIGVVKGVYMQGMVIELDEEVCLLMTEDSLVFPCSVRVGAILHVRNVHIVNPKFQWGKMLILGACSKTNITTISFSPWETGCHLVLKSQSFLRKFIDSLVFPARLWVLLVVQCFRKKFSGFLSDKEILGSRHKEGLVQTYARSVLPSMVFQRQHGFFMDFCKPDSCGTGRNFSYGNLRLAVPLSSFLNNCDRIWFKSLLELKNGFEILENCSQANQHQPFRENKFSDQPIRRILPSKDIGISLVGNLKVQLLSSLEAVPVILLQDSSVHLISQDTGRMQVSDATGCIDAVISDLPSQWDLNVILEVVDYSLVLEGRPGLWETWVLDDDLFSCSSIFRSLLSERQTELTVYVHFKWNNVSCRHFSINHCLCSKDGSAVLDPGIFHLLCLAHKFPLQPQFHGDLIISESFHLFAEVIVLPWDLNVVPSGNAAKSSKDETETCARNDFAIKRCKTYHASSCIDKVEFCSKFEDFGNNLCRDTSKFLSLPHKTRKFYDLCGPSPVQIPCTVSVRGIHGQNVAVAGTLCYSQGVGDLASLRPTSSRKLLLEFDSKNMATYKLMHIGGYYIMTHHAGKCFCDSDDINLGNKVAINMETRLLRTSLNFTVVGSSSGTCNDPLSGSCYSSKVSSRHHLQNELVLGSAADESCSDVSIHFEEEAIDHLDVGVQSLKEAVIAPSMSPANISNGQQVGCRISLVDISQNHGGFSGNSLSEGNLVSLRGTVMSFQRSDAGAVDGIHLNKIWKDPIFLHVLSDGHMLQIGGCLSRHDFPVGLAPGADVTFHRILALSGQSRLILTPVSFITVHSVREALTDLHPHSSVIEETIPSLLISDLIQSDTCKLNKLRCRVVGVYIVILERDKNLDKLLSSVRSRTPTVNIPLAGFILDDGSSRCFCWANGERAATLLRLHEEAPQARSGSIWWRSEATISGKSCRSPSARLNRILKKHGRIAVTNRGSIHDSLGQNLQLSTGSDCIFGTQDQNLLKFMVFNACSSTFWSITGHVMDSNAVNALEKFLLEEQMTVHALQNVWAKDVSQVNTLTEARALFQELEPESIKFPNHGVQCCQQLRDYLLEKQLSSLPCKLKG